MDIKDKLISIGFKSIDNRFTKWIRLINDQFYYFNFNLTWIDVNIYNMNGGLVDCICWRNHNSINEYQNLFIYIKKLEIEIRKSKIDKLLKNELS